MSEDLNHVRHMYASARRWSGVDPENRPDLEELRVQLEQEFDAMIKSVQAEALRHAAAIADGYGLINPKGKDYWEGFDEAAKAIAGALIKEANFVEKEGLRNE